MDDFQRAVNSYWDHRYAESTPPMTDKENLTDELVASVCGLWKAARLITTAKSQRTGIAIQTVQKQPTQSKPSKPIMQCFGRRWTMRSWMRAGAVRDA
jgi:hypothetical protein